MSNVKTIPTRTWTRIFAGVDEGYTNPAVILIVGEDHDGRLHVIHNPHWETGQASSLHASVHALPASVEAAVWMPVDQPYLDAALLRRLAWAWRRGADLAAPVADGELRGAPALFDRRRWPALLQVEGDVGGRAVLRRFAGEIVTVPAAAATLRDIDYPDDLSG